jgi:hypothetical protein
LFVLSIPRQVLFLGGIDGGGPAHQGMGLDAGKTHLLEYFTETIAVRETLDGLI